MALLEVIFVVGLLFEVGNSQENIYLQTQSGKDVTLHCGSQTQPQQCSDISWFYNRDSSESSAEAQRGEINQTSPRADRMSLDINCSLVIENVTAEDVGHFTCQQDGQEEVHVYLSLSRTRCKTTAKADIVLLVDDSSSIYSEDFRTILRFITDMVGMFDIGPDRVQIGLTRYSSKPRTQWNLNTHRTKESLLNDVNKMQQTGGMTMTGQALTHILENDFKPNVGMREDSQKIGILFTDGESMDNVTMPSQNLRDNGIELYAIGVGDANLRELKSIASDPHDTHVNMVKNFNLLQDIITRLTDSLCDSIKGPDA